MVPAATADEEMLGISVKAKPFTKSTHEGGKNFSFYLYCTSAVLAHYMVVTPRPCLMTVGSVPLRSTCRHRAKFPEKLEGAVDGRFVDVRMPALDPSMDFARGSTSVGSVPHFEDHETLQSEPVTGSLLEALPAPGRKHLLAFQSTHLSAPLGWFSLRAAEREDGSYSQRLVGR